MTNRIAPKLILVGMKHGQDRYVLLFDEANRGEALRTLGRWASNPELGFSWYDAAILSQKIRGTYVKGGAK